MPNHKIPVPLRAVPLNLRQLNIPPLPSTASPNRPHRKPLQSPPHQILPRQSQPQPQGVDQAQRLPSPQRLPGPAGRRDPAAEPLHPRARQARERGQKRRRLLAREERGELAQRGSDGRRHVLERVPRQEDEQASGDHQGSGYERGRDCE
ncbi:hypothetical protein LINGRAHAP2_LOCUS16187 [Linum grandiflorum]